MKGFFPFLHRVIEVKEALILPRFCRRRLFSADLHFMLASSWRHVVSNSSALDESTEVLVLKSSRECNIMRRRKGKKRRNSFNFNHNGVVKTRFKMYAFTPSALHFSWSYYLHSISLDHQNRKIKGVRLALRLSLRPQYNFAPLAFNKTLYEIWIIAKHALWITLLLLSYQIEGDSTCLICKIYCCVTG